MKRTLLLIILSTLGVAVIGITYIMAPHFVSINAGASVKSPKVEASMESETYRVPILMYHIVADYSDPKVPAYSVSIPVQQFKDEMAYLSDNHFVTLTMPDYRAYKELGLRLPQKAVIISFDDAQHSVYDTVYPLLLQYGFKAQLYVVTDYAENKNNQYQHSYMSWDALKDVVRTNTFAIGSHSVSHVALATLKPDQIHTEIFDSKRILEEKLGITVEDFAYPKGSYTADIVRELKNAGYKSAVTVEFGMADPKTQDMLMLHRFDINRHVTLDQFKIYVNGQ